MQAEDVGLDVGRYLRGNEFTMEPSVLTKHAIVLGATGSGKTVLCKAIIEEAALRGIPVLAIDPKGDISCLAICSKDYAFRPWSDVDADIKRTPREEYAQGLQKDYADKAAEFGTTKEKVSKFAENVEVRIYTPKSSAGIPVSISPKLDAPPQFSRLAKDEPSIISDLLDISVTSLLNIIRPGRSDEDRQAVSYLSAILESQWQLGNGVDLTGLIDLVLHPPFTKIGNLQLDQTFPKKERMKLAGDLNLFNTDPKLRAWVHGSPLDFDKLFQTGGKTPVNVIDLRGIQTQGEKSYFVAMLLQQLYGWMMKQQGVQNLRYILYFDELVGFCPAVGEPPSKKTLILLIKQARAFGLGLILAAQNSIDLDYKVISNANVRFIGRLGTEQDIERVKKGLEAPSEVADTIHTLEEGQFFCQIFDPRSSGIITPRWLMTYHRGPLQDAEISALMKDVRAGDVRQTPSKQEPTLIPPGPEATAPSQTGQEPMKQQASPSPQSLACPNCGTTNLADAKFCERCGTKLGTQPKPPIPPTIPSLSVSLPLFAVPPKLTEDSIRSQGEATKVGLFGLTGKRTIIGKKPEEYIVLESMDWANRVYVRVHGVYTSRYLVDVYFPLTVGEDTIEVEVPGANRMAPVKGTLKLAAKLRKVSRTESTFYYDERVEEVQIQLPPKTELQPLRTVQPPLRVDDLQKLLLTTLDWAKKGMQIKMGKPQGNDAVIEEENLDLSDHEVILVPYCTLTFFNSKTGERKKLVYDSLQNSFSTPFATPR
jgi:hypothetical protein